MLKTKIFFVTGIILSVSQSFAIDSCNEIFANFKKNKYSAQQILDNCKPNGNNQIDDIFRICYRADFEDKLTKNVLANCNNAKKACQVMSKGLVWCNDKSIKSTDCTCDYHNIYLPSGNPSDLSLPVNDVFKSK